MVDQTAEKADPKTGFDVKQAGIPIVAALVLGFPGMLTFMKDTPSRVEMREFVRENSPYVQDRQFIKERLDEVRTKVEDSRASREAFNLSLTRLSAQVENLNRTIQTLDDRLSRMNPTPARE